MALPVVEAARAEVAGVEHGVDLGGGRSSGELGVGVREHGRRQRGVLRPPGVALSTAACSVAALGNGGYGGDIAGGVGFSARCERRLEREVGHGERGNRVKGSPRSCREG